MTPQPPVHAPPTHPAVALGRVGLLIVNLGTPDSTRIRDIRRYLKQFLSDRRVIEVNPWIWKPLLYGVILRTRPPKTAAAYAAIWDQERDESPLRTITRDQAEGLAERFKDIPGLTVDWAMRYGQPSIPDRLRALQAEGCDRIAILALYPHYAAATTATVHDEAFRTLLSLRWQPALRTSGPWHDHPVFIKALSDSLTQHLATLDWEPDLILASYHGMPKRYLDSGDPYHCHCRKTTRLMLEHLGWPAERIMTCFQSRFGREEWLQPYTDETLKALPGRGIKKVVVITPAFVADCVETLEEIRMGGEELFHHAGGTAYSVVPCLNASPGGLDVLEAMARRDLAGWLPV